MIVTAFFTENFAPKTGLTPAVSVLRLSDNTIVVSAQTMLPTLLTGYYYYSWSTHNPNEEYVIVADGGSTLNNVERYLHGGVAKNDHIAAETTATAGSTTTEIRTGLTQVDDFFNNMQVVIVNAAGIVARNIEKFANANGAIFVTELPFTPDVNDLVIILRRTSERIRDRFDPTGLFK